MAEKIEMGKQALKALKGSIAHWEDVKRAPVSTRIGASACALCWQFPDCVGCPVMMRTGNDSCIGTPYHAFLVARAGYRPGTSGIADLRKAAQAELDFLRSLLPGA